MAEWVYGMPASAGDTFPASDLNTGVTLAKVKKDGTRRLESHMDSEGLYNLFTSIGARSPIPADLDGYIPLPQSSYGRLANRTLTELTDGLWLGWPDAVGVCSVETFPVTPGDAFYKFRRIVAEHAHQFRHEHNTANLVYESLEHRIETVAHELSDTDRMKAGNVSVKVRSDIGYLWRLIHDFVKMPFGTDTNDQLWHAKRNGIVYILEPFCEMCEGQGLARRILLKHPYEEWKGYLDGGIRFSSSRDFVAKTIENTQLLTNAVINNDIRNFNQALDFFGEGYPEDDYGGDGLKTKSEIVPEPTGAPMITHFTGDHAIWRSSMIGYWRLQVDKAHARSELTPLARTVFEWFAAANVIATLRDYAVSNDLIRGALNDNRKHVSGDNYGPVSVGGIGFAALYGAYSPAAADPWFKRLRWFFSPDSVVTLDLAFLPLYPGSERDTGTEDWALASRTTMATRLEGIFGRRILENTGDPIL